MEKRTETKYWYENGVLKGVIGKTIISKDKEGGDEKRGNIHNDDDFFIMPMKKREHQPKIFYDANMVGEALETEIEDKKDRLQNQQKKLQRIKESKPFIITIVSTIWAIAGIIAAIFGVLRLYGPTTTIIATLIATIIYTTAGAVLGFISGTITRSACRHRYRKCLAEKQSLKIRLKNLEESKKMIGNII